MNIKGKAKFLVLSGALIGITSQHSFAINEINEENNPQTNNLIRNTQDVPHNDDHNIQFDENNDSIEESSTGKPDNQGTLDNLLNVSGSDLEDDLSDNQPQNQGKPSNKVNFQLPNNNLSDDDLSSGDLDADLSDDTPQNQDIPLDAKKNNDNILDYSDADLSDNTPQNKVKFQLPNNNLSDDDLSSGDLDADLSDDQTQNQAKPLNITNLQNQLNNNKFFNNPGSDIEEEEFFDNLDNNVQDNVGGNPVKTFQEFSSKIRNRDESIFNDSKRFEEATQEVIKLEDSFENLTKELNDARSSLDSMHRSLEKERFSSGEKDKKLAILYKLEGRINELEGDISFKEQKLGELATQLQNAKEKKSSYKQQLQELSVQRENILQIAQRSEKEELLKLRKQQELTNRYLRESSEKDIAGLIAARNEERRQLIKMHQSNQELTEILQQTKGQYSEAEEQLSDLNNKLRSFAIGIGLIDQDNQNNYGFDQILEASYQQYQQSQKESIAMRNKLESSEEQIHILNQKLNNKKEKLNTIKNQVIDEDNYSVNEEDQLLNVDFDNNQDDSNFNKFAQIKYEKLQNSSNKAGFNEFAQIRGEKLKAQSLEKSEEVVDENASQHSDAKSPSKIQKNDNFGNFAKIRQGKLKNSEPKQTQNNSLKVSSVDTKKDDSKFNQFSDIRKSKLNNQKNVENNSIQDNQDNSDSEA